MYNTSHIVHNFKKIINIARTGETVYFKNGEDTFTIRRQDRHDAIELVLNRLEAVEASVFGETTVGPKRMDSLEMPCCSDIKPCKHWSWDSSTGAGYVNSLSGRVKEA